MPVVAAKRAAAANAHRRGAALPVIGWREWLAIPTLGIERIKAKIDTGARSSALHAFDIRVLTERGAPHVAFTLCPEQRRRNPAVECVAPILDERRVTSSTGHRQNRYVITVAVALGPLSWPIEVSLVNRNQMGFRMLLGREALRGRFLVDAGRSHLTGRRLAPAFETP